VPSDLDRKFDAVLTAVTGPGGPIQIGRDSQGRAIITNLPPTLPGLFDAFCALHANTIAVIADRERLTFAELNAQATRLAKVLVGGWGIRKGDRVGIAMRNAPAWIVSYMAILKAGGIATLINGWWEAEELRHAVALTGPKLVIADAPRARRIEATELGIDLAVLPIERPIDEALAPLLERGGEEAELPEVAPENDATILFTSGSTGAAKGAVSTHRAVTTGVYAYTMSLATMLGIKQSEGNPPVNPPRTMVAVPLFHVTGEVPVMLNSFAIGRDRHLLRRRADHEP
jgi:acyl-CoA synthetase (AMP-forming)/AMP-acid ligase II